MRQLSFQSFSGVKLSKFLWLVLALAFGLRVFYNNYLNNLTKNVILLDLLTLVLVFLVYVCAMQISKSEIGSLLSAAIVALMPFNFVSWREVGAAIFLLVALFGLLNIKEKTGIILLVSGAVISALLHYSALFIAPAFAIYLLITGLEDHKFDFEEIKYFLMVCVIVGFIVLLITKLPPAPEVPTYLSLKGLLEVVGTRPILFGVLGAYLGLVHKNRGSLLFLSLAIASFGLLLFNYIMTDVGLTYMILSFSVLACFDMQDTLESLRKSRLKDFKNVIIAAWFAIVFAWGIWHWLASLV